MTEEDLIEARKRAQEYRKMAEEECPDGGFLFADLGKPPKENQ
jgi:hypothetical protein